MTDTPSFSDQVRQALRESMIPAHRLVDERIGQRAIYGFLRGDAVRSDTLDAILDKIGATKLKLPTGNTIRRRFNQTTDNPVIVRDGQQVRIKRTLEQVAAQKGKP